MTAPEKRTAARYTVLLCELLQKDGVDAAQLLQAAGIAPARLALANGHVTLSESAAFVAAARRATGRSDLGFALGCLISPTAHDLLGFGMLGCRNFDEVQRLLSRHFHLVAEPFSLRYQRGATHGEVLYTPLTAMQPELLHFFLEVIAASQEIAIRHMVPGPLPAYDMRLSMPAPVHLARYAALAPVRFHFDAQALPGVRILMPAALLDRPLPLANRHLVQQVDARLAAQARRPPRGEAGWSAYVTMMLRDAVGEQPNLEQFARHVNVSARTLVRHLAKEGRQFSEIAERARFERACEMLVAGDATVSEVALALGFSNAANFSRAFRRVLGTSPGDYRQRASAAAQAVP